jgi:hypothetical protein
MAQNAARMCHACVEEENRSGCHATSPRMASPGAVSAEWQVATRGAALRLMLEHGSMLGETR